MLIMFITSVLPLSFLKTITSIQPKCGKTSSTAVCLRRQIAILSDDVTNIVSIHPS